MKVRDDQMKLVASSSVKKASKKKLTGDSHPLQQKVVRTTDLGEIDDLFHNLKQSKKLKLEVPVIAKSSSTSQPSTSAGVLENDGPVVENMKQKKPPQQMSELPHGMVKSNNHRIIISPEAPVERIDPESGYKVYKAHILKVGEGGGTELCPFDCDCCF